MKKELSTGFDARQYMQSDDFEIFYYKDVNLSRVSLHAHDHYEFYFFLEGRVTYRLGSRTYRLEPGDYLLIPPGVEHNAETVSPNTPYRRFVLWLSPSFFRSLCEQDPEGYGYAFHYAAANGGCHFRPDYVTMQEILGLLMEMLEEQNHVRPFRGLSLHLKLLSFLVFLNRLTHEQLNEISPSYENALYLSVCDYINQHLDETLSLDQIASFFYVSKYHIAHVFKDNMGISLHQYILKKRLHACKNAILTGMAFAKIYEQYGFHDYTVFYRAFKKEYGMSPTEYKEQHSMEQAAVPKF
ncbi:MAG: AraC family transcriptional regulator [Eubacteriales bacterium]|nr:AraC family transcriptional regulator [Eubacteriales bacterium]